jgi:hypothetical protein
LCFVSVLCVLLEFVDHGGRRGNTAQALTRWRHPVASSEALDVLHRAMRPASYRCIAMADTPDPTRVTSSKGVGRGCIRRL